VDDEAVVAPILAGLSTRENGDGCPSSVERIKVGTVALNDLTDVFGTFLVDVSRVWMVENEVALLYVFVAWVAVAIVSGGEGLHSLSNLPRRALDVRSTEEEETDHPGPQAPGQDSRRIPADRASIPMVPHVSD
jgi:hypothetical protein